MRHLRLILILLLILATATPVSAREAKKWPPDAMDVSYTLAAELTGQRGLSFISFAPGVRDYLAAGSEGEYNAFTRSRISPLFYSNSNPGNRYNAEVGGSIHLYDGYNRLVSMQYSTQYAVNGKRINVTQALAIMSSPSNLSLETYMVPIEEFKDGLPESRRGDWPTLYTFAREHAYTSADPDRGQRAYLVMTFVMNRLPADALFEVVVSPREKAWRTLDNIAKDKQTYLDYDGWRVHMFVAQLNPSSLRQRFYCNYFYTPGAGIPEAARKRIQAASFSSKPEGSPAGQSRANYQAPAPQASNAPPAPQAVAPRQAPATPGAAGGQGPVGRGLSFLNPLFPDDMTLIQTRLAQLGHYTGAVDGSFGPMTQKAMDDFAVRHGFPKGQWSLGLQKALFRGTGL
jgi:hypothetical protein